MKLRPARSTADASLISRLADICWREHYTPIIGGDQVDYMLDRFQSTPAIISQIKEGRCYFIIESADGAATGYLAYDEAPDHLFLSKLYILPNHQGRGIGRMAVEELADRHPTLAIHLTVNKHNHGTIAFYHKVGFINTGPTVADIGGGFVMDDWKMEKSPLSRP